MLLHVVQAQRDDFKDDVHKDLFPILFFFFLHKSKITKNLTKLFMFIDIVYTEECPGEGTGLAKGYQKGGMDLALRVNEDATEEENEASDGEHKGCYEL